MSRQTLDGYVYMLKFVQKKENHPPNQKSDD